MPKPIKMYFPYAVKESFGSEGAELSLGEINEDFFLRALFCIEQHLDQFLAYRHVEQHWLAKDIHQLTAADLVTLAKEINFIAAAALTTIKPESGVAGNFLEIGTVVGQETGLPEQRFESRVDFSKHNYDILKQTHGEAVADQYRTFCHYVFLEILPRIDLSTADNFKFISSLLRAYKDDSRQQAYSKIFKYISADTVPAEYFAFAEKLTAKIAAGSDPVHIAAFALAQQALIHPFPHGNRRSARIFINTLLMMLGEAPIIIPKEEVNNYYIAIEKSTAEDFTLLENILRKYAGNNIDYEYTLAENFFPLHAMFDNGEMLICNEFNYTLRKAVSPVAYSLAATLGNNSFAEIYLAQATKYQSSNPIVANYYYHRYQRIAQTPNSELVSLFRSATQPLIADDNAKVQASKNDKKVIYQIGLNETARLSGEKAKTAGIYTILHTVDLAVLFKDEEGNISLTHMHSRTSLDREGKNHNPFSAQDRHPPSSFLEREAKKMRGKFTIDVIRAERNKSRNDEAVHAAIKTFCGDIPNQKGNNETRVVSDTLLILDGKLLKPNADIMTTLNAFNVKFLKIIDKKIPAVLHNAVVTTSSKPFSIRETEHLLELIRNETTNCKPVVVVDNDWTNEYPELISATQAILRDILDEKMGEQYQKYFIAAAKKVKGDARQVMIDILDKFLNNYRHEAKHSVYGTVATFFHSIKKPMPSSALSIITDYVETEELGIFRVNHFN